MASPPPPPYPAPREGGPAPAPPPSVRNAVKLMYVGAGVELLGILAAAGSQHTIRVAVEKAAASGGRITNIDAAVRAATAALVIVGLIACGLWVWMAMANAKGRSWARVTGTVLWGLNTLALAGNLAQPGAPATRAFAVVVWLVGGAVVFLLWRPESSAFYHSPYQGTFG